MHFRLNDEWRVFLARVWRWALGIPVLVLVFVASANAADDLAEANAPGLRILLFWILIYVCVFVHELGHALAARAVGFRVHMFAVAPIAYRVIARKFSYLTRNESGDFAGFVVALPPEGTDWNRGRLAVVSGGPLANYLLAGICFALGPMVTVPLSALLHAFALSSLALGVANTIPAWGPGKLRNDGAALVNELVGKRPSEQDERHSRLWALSADGVPPSSWNAELVARVEEDVRQDGDDGKRELLLVSYYFSNHDLRRAYDILKSSRVARVGTIPALTIECAFVIGLVEHDAASARRILDSVPEWRAEKLFAYWRAKAVIETLSGNPTGACRAVSHARMVARKAKEVPDEDDIELFAAIEKGTLPVPSWVSVREAA